jgi:hypothetical protein
LVAEDNGVKVLLEAAENGQHLEDPAGQAKADHLAGLLKEALAGQAKEDHQAGQAKKDQE